MTPAARIAAAIEVLDRVLAGDAPERVLANWGRGNRYAGSGDRRAVRDHVFDALRRRRSYAAWGGSDDGRGVMLGALRAAGTDPATVFGAGGHAPACLAGHELAAPTGPWPEGIELDAPDWLLPQLRVNLARISRPAAAERLAGEGIETRPHGLSPAALEVVSGARRIAHCRSFRDGEVELQDAASQAVSDAIPVPDGARVLDLCAGGGGKTLALAGRVAAHWFAHDVDARRMSDLPARAARAGVHVTLLHPGDLAAAAPFDVVLVDAPCSGSGTWRRDPAAKWSLTPERLHELTALQSGLLDQAARHVGRGGVLAYVTCSLLPAENRQQIARFIARTEGWTESRVATTTLLTGGDGFYLALLTRD